MGDGEMKESVDVAVCGLMNDTSALPINITKPSHSWLSILTKLYAGYFFICLSFGAQALLWKSLSKHSKDSHTLWHGFNLMPSVAFLLLWYVALFIATTLSMLYVLKCILYFDVVKVEFTHHIGVNCVYAPWISWLLMLQSAPMILHTASYYHILCLALSVVIFLIDIKLYGQWFTTKRRFLSIVANPTSQVSVIANLVSAQVIAEIGGNQFPIVLRPDYFLFFAAPSMASLACKSIAGAFVTPSKILLFMSLFLFLSQACRPALFKKSLKNLNVTWWFYSFPLTFLGLACTEYAQLLKTSMAAWLMLVICMVSVLVFIALMIITVLKIERLLNENAPITS